MRNSSKTSNKEFSIAQTSAADLMGKQSVRATFRLSSACIDAISIIAAQLGIKQKSLFDHLMEDADSLAAIARHADPDKLNREGRIQKTFVISRKSLSTLDTISKNFGASRDDLVEYSVHRLFPVIAKERQKQDMREALSFKIAEHFKEGKTLLDEIKHLLGTEDLIYKTMVTVLATYEKAFNLMESFIEKGKRIEDFPMEKFNQT